MQASTSSSRSLSRSLLCRCSRPSQAAPVSFALRRNLHSRPNLPYDTSDGVTPFLSRQALQGTARTWHQGCLDRLNDLARGTQYENKSVAQTVIDAAKRREDTLIFNYASEALNNGFFLSCLTPTPSESSSASNPGGLIEEAIKNSFGSPTSFVNRFSSFANGMFGTGYVWLVMDAVDNLAVVGTYGAGTVLVQGGVERAPEVGRFVNAEDGTSLSGQSEGVTQTTEQQIRPDQMENASSTNASVSLNGYGHVRSFSTSASTRESRLPGGFPAQSRQPTVSSFSTPDPMGLVSMGTSSSASSYPRRANVQRFQSIHPLLCLSLHPHVYIPDYGIWGKEEYIKNFWQNVDWSRLDQRYQDVRAAYNVGKSASRQNPIGQPRFQPRNNAAAERDMHRAGL